MFSNPFSNTGFGSTSAKDENDVSMKSKRGSSSSASSSKKASNSGPRVQWKKEYEKLQPQALEDATERAKLERQVKRLRHQLGVSRTAHIHALQSMCNNKLTLHHLLGSTLQKHQNEFMRYAGEKIQELMNHVLTTEEMEQAVKGSSDVNVSQIKQQLAQSMKERNATIQAAWIADLDGN